MGALNNYLSQVQTLLGTGATGNLYPNSQLTAFINEGRRQVAMRGQCVRALSPIAGPISSISITSPGSGYTSTPSVVISGPDFPLGNAVAPQGIQASGICTISGAQLSAVTVLSTGNGYFSPGIAFINGSPASQATAIAIVSNISVTTVQQEQYPFSQTLQCIQNVQSGIQSIVAVRSVAFLWGNYRYVRVSVSFSKYQALIRNYNNQYTDVPTVVSQYGQGVSGTLYMYPPPNSNYQMEWDCICLPTDLTSDSDPEVIPQPWQDCVQYYAAYKAYLQAQRYADADRYFTDDPKKPKGLFQQFMDAARSGSMPSMTSNWYGRAP